MELRKLSEGRRDVLSIPLNKITVDAKFNVRQDYGDIDGLARSIAESGQKQPGKVRQGDDCAILVDGHRRLQAIRLANEKYGASIKAFLCFTEERGANEESRILDMLVLNDGKPLSIIEQAVAVKRLQDYGWKDSDIAGKIGKSSSYICGLMSLNGASNALRKAVKDSLISPTAAIKLASAPEAKQVTILERIAALENPVAKGKGKAVKVKDVEKAIKGVPSVISSKVIKDKIEAVKKLRARKPSEYLNGVKFGLEAALGIVELPAA